MLYEVITDRRKSTAEYQAPPRRCGRGPMKKLLSFPFLSFFLLAGQAAVADEFKIIPYASIREEYNDNIYFSDDTNEEDFITTTAVGVITSYSIHYTKLYEPRTRVYAATSHR